MANILVLDYDKSVRAYVTIAFQSEGHSVYAFEDARTVLDAVCFDDMDLVVTDLEMPMPGDEVITRLRERGLDIPILVTVPLLTESVRQHLLSLGAQEILQKPFDLTQILSVAARHLGQPAILATRKPQAERLASYEHRPFVPLVYSEASPN
jgi:DNA-binding response OmpR family regulator